MRGEMSWTELPLSCVSFVKRRRTSFQKIITFIIKPIEENALEQSVVIFTT